MRHRVDLSIVFVWTLIVVFGILFIVSVGRFMMSVAQSQTPTPAPASVQFQPFAIGSPSPVPLLPSATASAKDDAKDSMVVGVTPVESKGKKP